MIRRVTLEGAEWNDLPYKFEAGTPAIAEAIGLGVAVDYLNGLGMAAVRAHEKEIVAYAMERLAEVPGVQSAMARLIPNCTAAWRPSRWMAFIRTTWRPFWTRKASPCAPGITVPCRCICKLGLPATTRASFYIYTLPEEMDALVEAMYRAKQIMSRKPVL